MKRDDRLPDECEWGGERYRSRPFNRKRDLAWGVVYVLLTLIAMIALSKWITDEWPFTAHAANLTTVHADGFEGDDPAGADPCASPLVLPDYRVTLKTWTQCFTPRDGNPKPTYPSSNGFPIPLGAPKGEATACAFVAQPDQVTNLFWDGAQANPNEGYFTARPADAMFLGIDTCAGSLRQIPGCWRYTNTGTLVTSTRHPPSDFYCALTPGVTYYLNISPMDPTDGLQDGEHSCKPVPSSEAGCDVQARQTVN